MLERALCVVLALEAGIVLLAAAPGHRPGPPPAEPSTDPAPAATARAPATVAPSGPTPAEAAERILARPLFTPGRHPPAISQSSPVPAASPLPRLTGIVVTPSGRQALFATVDLPLGVGAHLGPFTIAAITPDTVELDGPFAPHTLRPAPDPLIRPAGAALPVPLLDPYRRETETENDQ